MANQTPPRQIAVRQSWAERWFPNREWALALLLIIELAAFAVLGRNFATAENAAELVRLGVEVGLLALAMTPIIVTGGIDLSVGSLMGLSAVTMGWLVEVQGLAPGAAALAVLGLGALAGGLNALLIARGRIPALIVTLGTFSLFRGLAEGLTGGMVSYSKFPPGYLALGQSYLLGLPYQLPVLLLAAAGYWLLLHRTPQGRGLYAIGSSIEGAHFTGLPVARRLTLVYVLSGLMSAAAALVYVARLGQAKADAGTGYELIAITAVVLGGTAITGGRGTILGTLLGLAAIVVLENGLRLAALPAELAQVLTGALLISAILAYRWAQPSAPVPAPLSAEEFEMKTSHVFTLSLAMVVSALIVAAGNWMLVSRLAPVAAGPVVAAPAPVAAPTAPEPTPAARPTIALMPKNKGDAYFVSCRLGAEEAAQEANVELLWDGPTQPDASKQNEVVEAWITRGVDAIAVSVENQAAISTVLRKARQRGIKVVTWDADSEKDARDYFINQATAEGIGQTLMDEAARVMGERGEFAIISASLTASNQNDWIKVIRARLAERYPNITLKTIEPSDDKRDLAFRKAQDILAAHPNVKLIMAIAAPAVPGAAEAVQQSGRADVKVIGLSLPNLCRTFIKDGVVDCIVLWNTVDLGYLTVLASKALVTGDLQPGATSLAAGRLGTLEVAGDEVLLGKPFVFNASNVDDFDF